MHKNTQQQQQEEEEERPARKQTVVSIVEENELVVDSTVAIPTLETDKSCVIRVVACGLCHTGLCVR